MLSAFTVFFCWHTADYPVTPGQVWGLICITEVVLLLLYSLGGLYILHYRVHDSSGKCSIVFSNHVAEDLIGKKEEHFLDEGRKGGAPQSFPAPLSEICGKEYVIKLRVKDYNLDNPFIKKEWIAMAWIPATKNCLRFNISWGNSRHD